MTAKTCARGHSFEKRSDCPVCPICEAARTAGSAFLEGLGAPARRALERAGLDTLAALARRSERELLSLHGIGPSAIPRLKQRLAEAGLALRDERPDERRDEGP